MGRTVLVADDSPSIQNKAKGILTGEGLEVVTVSNGVAAIKKLPSVKPSLVIADVAMPGRDGYEVCEFVKNSPELSFVPVVLVFSDVDPYDDQRGARARADATIKKSPGERDPFDHEELVAMVAKFLAQAETAAPEEAPPPPAGADGPDAGVHRDGAQSGIGGAGRRGRLRSGDVRRDFDARRARGARIHRRGDR